jgi:Carboxypeptidase regulatory-like domain
MRQIISTTLLAAVLSIVALGQAEQKPQLFKNSKAFQKPLPVHKLIQAKKNFLISGQVVDELGQPVSGAHVNARPDHLSGKLPSSISDLQGRFTISVYKPGRWYLTASKNAAGYPSMASPFYYPAEELIPLVIIDEAQPVPFVTVRFLPPAGRLTGRVVDKVTKQPISNAEIRLCRVEAPRFCHKQRIFSPTGNYQILVPSSAFLMQVTAEGYKDWFTDENNLQQKPFEVASNTIRELNISLTKALAADGSTESLAAPRPVSPASGTEFYHFPRMTVLEWAPVPEAASYTVEVEFCSGNLADLQGCKDPHPLLGMKVPPSSGLKTTTYEFEFLGNQPGRWRVWAVDAQGRPGAKSEWSLFFYRK